MLGVALLAACGTTDDSPADGLAATESVATTEPVDPGSTTPPAAPSDTTAPAGGSEPAAAAGDYQAMSSPAPTSLQVDQRTDPIIDPLPDGEYWSWDYTSDGRNVNFILVQYFVGDACRERFDDCASDNNTLQEPSATVSLSPAAPTSVVWCCPGGSFESYRVSNPEFARLVAGLAPASDAPTGFSYSRSGAVVTVRDGEAVAVDQVFTS